MKKIIFFLVGCIVGLTTATAQINSYSFAYTAGTYSEISGGTVVYSGAAQGVETLRLENYAFAPGDTLISEIADVSGYPIGFSFNLGEQAFTHFAISPNGFIYLGGSAPFPVDATEVSNDGAIKPVLSDDNRFENGTTNVLGFSHTGSNSATTADANTEIGYLLSGDAGNQVLIIQFKKIIVPETTNPVDIQIRLYEAGSRVELIFNNFTIGSNTAWAEIGLKGDVLGNTKYVALTPNNNWSVATAGVTGNVSFRNTICNNGTTFTFTPPPACEAPGSQPTDLQLTATSNSISGSFTAAEADKYLVLRGQNIIMITGADRPADGVTYNVGEIINNKLTVVAYSPETTFSTDSLEGSSEYIFYVYAANSECLYGPKYRKLGALSGKIKTLPAAPKLSLAEGGFTSLKLAVEANTVNDPVIVAQNIGQWAIDENNNHLNDGVFGAPTLNLNVGDNIPGGGKIVYKGPASGATEVTGLAANKLVNFAAWSYNESDNAISGAPVLFNVLTWGETPYVLNAGQFTSYDIPVDWEQEGNFRLEEDNSTGRGSYLSCNGLPASETGSYASITTQYLKLAPGANRLHLTGRLFQTANARPYPENDLTEWDAKDSLQVLIIKYGTTDTVAVHTVKAANAFGGNFDVVLPITGFANDIVKVKLAWRVHSIAKSNSLHITSYIIEEKPDHEAPVNLTVDPASIAGGRAEITWEKHATGTESAWEVRYRRLTPLDTETWSTPVETSEPSYSFTTLPIDVSVEVQVRAVVGLNVHSPWTVPALSFKTGRGLPYNEDFDSYTTAATFTAGSGWTLTVTTAVRWVSSELRFSLNQTSPPKTASGLLPKLDFGDGSVNYQLAFDLSTSGASENDSIYVIVKTEGEDVILKEYSNTVAGRDTIALAGFAGIQQIGFKVIESVRNNSAYFALDNVSVFPAGPPTGIASIKSALQVFASNRIINVLNPEGAYIDNICLYALDGSLLQNISVHSSGNVFIPAAISQTIVIVKIYGKNGSSAFKILIK